MEPTGETSAADIVVPSASNPGPSRWRGQWWIPVALVAAIGGAAVVLTVGSDNDGERSIEPATTVVDGRENSLPTSTDATDATDAPSRVTQSVVDESSPVARSTPTSDAIPTSTQRRGATTTAPVQPTSTWLPGLEGVGWTLGGPFPNEITDCETAEYMAVIFDPYDITTSLTLSWTYIDASGSTVSGDVPLQKSWWEHLASEWTGTLVPSGAPKTELTPVYQTLTATDAAGESRVILGTSHLLWLSPCAKPPPPTTVPTTTESSTTVPSPLP